MSRIQTPTKRKREGGRIMSIIQKEITLVGSKGSQKVNALFDSGATYSMTSKNIGEKIANLEMLPEPMVFETATEEEYVQVEQRIAINFYIEIYRLSDEFLIADNITEDVIIGASTMQKWRLKLDFENDDVIVDPKVIKLMLK